MPGRLLAAWLSALSLCAAQSSVELSPDVLALSKIKTRMQHTLRSQPNYTCIEQIERSTRRAPRRKFELLDMLRLEVALVDGKELFAWPGSSKFEEGDMTDLVPAGGAIGNGNFALFAHSVFGSSSPAYRYIGEMEWKGRTALHYEYDVPQMLSGFHLRVGEREAIVGFHGSFLADKASFDVLKLEVLADQIPPALSLDRTLTVMEYKRAKIGETDFLLPSGSELIMTHISGDENRNRIQFSGCRQYTGDSVLSFGEAPAESSAPALPKQKTSLAFPASLSFQATLNTGLDTSKAMVGDAVEATLSQDIKHQKRILFPKGSTLSGRILRLERRGEFLVLELRFLQIASEDSQAELNGIVEAIQLIGLASGSQRRDSVLHQPPTGLLTWRSGRVHLPRGVRLQLLTRPAPPKS